MIYRVVVDFRNHATYVVTTSCILTGRSLRHLSRDLPGGVLKKLEAMKGKRFFSEEDFLKAVETALGREQFYAHQNKILVSAEKEYTETRRAAVPWTTQEARKMVGASYGWLAAVMEERGLRAPCITNQRARFYFTKLGWSRVGKYIAAEARRAGHIVKVIRRKEPDESQVLYRDELQLALLVRKAC
jgi:hypothetical protein